MITRAPALPTRGTTHPNRLRRVDRWLVATYGDRLRAHALAGRPAVVVDLGFGRHPATVVELAHRLRPLGPPAVDVVGVELDPDRVSTARLLAGDTPGVRFAEGGFGLEGVAGPVDVVRAFNVLRQYPLADVAPAWEAMRGRLAPGGLIVEGTCDEIGRLASWVVLGRGGPVSLVLSWRLSGLQRPGAVAARLPKALITRNVAPNRIHAFLTALDEAWLRAAATAPLGVRQRFLATCRAVHAAGWPVSGHRMWRHGTLEVAWQAVAADSTPPGSAGVATRRRC